MITDQEQLDALPFMTVIREQRPLRATGADWSRTWEKWREGKWLSVGKQWSADDQPTLPVVVLYEPPAGHRKNLVQ